MAGADVEREEAGRVEERVDAQDDARVADLEVLSAINRQSDETDVDRSFEIIKQHKHDSDRTRQNSEERAGSKLLQLWPQYKDKKNSL